MTLLIPFVTIGTNQTGVLERGSIRLVGGSGPHEGRVEVYVTQWGTICDDMWDLRDGNVVCRYLGFFNATEAITSSFRYGSGSGPILLDNVDCSGSETNIMDCPANPPGNHNCQHSEDAAVVCYTAGWAS